MMKNKIFGTILVIISLIIILCSCSLVTTKKIAVKKKITVTSAPASTSENEPTETEENNSEGTTGTEEPTETEAPYVTEEPYIVETPKQTNKPVSVTTPKTTAKQTAAVTAKTTQAPTAKTTAKTTQAPTAKTTAKATQAATAKATTKVTTKPTATPKPTPTMMKLSVTPAPRTASTGNSTYYNQLIAKGFTAVYAERLEALHKLHPNWTFEPQLITQMSRVSSFTKNGSAYTWTYVVDTEYTKSENLVSASSWAPGEFASLGVANYTPYYDASNTKLYDSGRRAASREANAYFLDPRNFLNEDEIFMFQAISYNSSVDTAANTAKTLAGSFMGDNAKLDNGKTYAQYIAEVAAKYNVSALNLASRLVSEHGSEPDSPLVTGLTGDKLYYYATQKPTTENGYQVWGDNFTASNVATKLAEFGLTINDLKSYNGYYNYFDVDAAGSGYFEIYLRAMFEAVEGGWTTQAKSIDGGASKYAQMYVACHQDTLYYQKFNVDPYASRNGLYSYNFWAQYMQSISTALTESRTLCANYVDSGVYNAAWVFKIPVYEGMPTNPAPDPGNGKCYYSCHAAPVSKNYQVFDAYSDCTITMLNGATGSYSSDACWCVTRKSTDGPSWAEFKFSSTINTSYFKYFAVFGEAEGNGVLAFYLPSGGSSLKADTNFTSGAVIIPKISTTGMTNTVRLPVYGACTKFYFNKIVFYNNEEGLRDYIYDSAKITIDSTKTNGNEITLSGWTAMRSMVESYGYIINGYVGYSSSFKNTADTTVQNAGKSYIGRTGDVNRFSITARKSSGQTVTFVVKLKYFDVPFILKSVT